MKKLFTTMVFLSLGTLAHSQIGINTESPTNTLDVNGTGRVRTVVQAPVNTLLTPVYRDATGVLTRPTGNVGNIIRNSANSVVAGATATLLTITPAIVGGPVLKAVVYEQDQCANIAVAEFYVTNNTNASQFAINGLGGLHTGATTDKSPQFTQISKVQIAVKWAQYPNCGAADPTSMDYTLTMSSAGTITVTNNSPVQRNYNIVATYMN